MGESKCLQCFRLVENNNTKESREQRFAGVK